MHPHTHWVKLPKSCRTPNYEIHLGEAVIFLMLVLRWFSIALKKKLLHPVMGVEKGGLEFTGPAHRKVSQ